MKFNRERTATRSELEGLEVYEAAFRTGQLERVDVPVADGTEEPGIWRVLPLEEVSYRDDAATEPLEISEVVIEPRELVVDELTRHRGTPQLFVPVTGSFGAVVAAGRSDGAAPDPDTLRIVPVTPGYAIEVGRGTWHTLPFSFATRVVGLSVMHREELDAYHDVRDLAAEGWVGVVTLPGVR